MLFILPEIVPGLGYVNPDSCLHSDYDVIIGFRKESSKRKKRRIKMFLKKRRVR